MTRRARTITLLVSVPLLVACVLLLALAPVPYVVLSPGPVFDALGKVAGVPVIAVDGARTYPTTGALDVVTVYETGGPGGRVTLLSALRAWVDPAQDLVPRELLYPDTPDSSDAREQSVRQMETSQQDAVAAALRYLDLPVTPVVAVGSVETGTPADGALEPGDVIVPEDGTAVTGPEQARTLIGDRAPGDDVTLTIGRDDDRRTVTVTTIPAPDDPTRPMVGIVPIVTFTSPIEVTIHLANVGGPSAGLVFALGTVDVLTPGGLAGGAHVAGTGTMSPNGRVGAIGGIAQKMVGARDSGATLFLAPRANCDDVAGRVPDGLTVVPVRTLAQAVDVVSASADGRTDLPRCG